MLLQLDYIPGTCVLLSFLLRSLWTQHLLRLSKTSTDLSAVKDVPRFFFHTSFLSTTVATTQLQYSAMAAEANGRPIDPTTAKNRSNGHALGRRPAGKKDITQSLSSKGFGWIARWVLLMSSTSSVVLSLYCIQAPRVVYCYHCSLSLSLVFR